MPGECIVGDSGLCCCAPCYKFDVIRALLIPFVYSQTIFSCVRGCGWCVGVSVWGDGVDVWVVEGVSVCLCV